MACFQEVGSVAVSSEQLKSLVIDGAKTEAQSLSILVGIESGPCAFEGLRLFSCFSTSALVKVMVHRLGSLVMQISGKIVSTIGVKVLWKKLLNIAAIPLLSDTLELLVEYRNLGTPRDLVLDFKKVQKRLGFCVRLMQMSVRYAACLNEM